MNWQDVWSVMHSAEFGALAMLVWQVLVTPLVAKMPAKYSGLVFALVRVLHGIWGRKQTSSIGRRNGPVGMGLLVFLVLLLAGCSSTLAESRRPVSAVGAAPLSARCVKLSDRQRWESSFAKGGIALTGLTGLGTFPAETRTEKAAVAGTAIVVAAATAILFQLSESDSASFVAECR